MDWGLILTLLIQVGSIAFFAGVLKSTQAHHKEAIKKLEEGHDKTVEKLEKGFKEKINELKAYFQEKFNSLEQKQDKHNKVIERTYCLERDVSVIKEQIKVENHRLDDLEETQHDCQKRGCVN